MQAPLPAAALLLAAGAAAAGFADPLDVAAGETRLATRAPVVAVAASGEQVLAAGPRGLLLRSADGGATWAQSPSPVSADLTSVRFDRQGRAFAVGHDGVVLSSLDAGRTWQKRLDRRDLGARRDTTLLDVGFADARTGLAVGAFGLVLRTDDGGETWRCWPDAADNPRDLHLYAIASAGGGLWAVGEQGLVLRLDPERRRLRAVPVPYGGTFFGVAGDERTVLVHGLAGHAFLSRDRGATWTRAETGVDDTITAATFLPGGGVVLATLAGELRVSDDGGARFRAPSGAPASRGVALPPAFALAVAGSRAVVAGPAGVRVEALP